jgi:hypothetical protein
MTTQTLDPVAAPRTRKEQLAEIASGRFFEKLSTENTHEIPDHQPSNKEAWILFPNLCFLFAQAGLILQDELIKLLLRLKLPLDSPILLDIPHNTGCRCKNPFCTHFTLSNPIIYNRDYIRWLLKQFAACVDPRLSFDLALYCPRAECQHYEKVQAAKALWSESNRGWLEAHLTTIRSWSHLHSPATNAKRRRAWALKSYHRNGGLDDDIVRERRVFAVQKAGGRLTKSGKLYSPASITHLQQVGRVTREDQMLKLVNAKIPVSTGLPFPTPDEQNLGLRSKPEALLVDWLRGLDVFSGVDYPELDDPQNANIPSVSPHGLLNFFVQDIGLYYHDMHIGLQLEPLAYLKWQLLSTLQHHHTRSSFNEREAFCAHASDLVQILLHHCFCQHMERFLPRDQKPLHQVYFLDTKLAQQLIHQPPPIGKRKRRLVSVLNAIATAAHHTLNHQLVPLIRAYLPPVDELVVNANRYLQELAPAYCQHLKVTHLSLQNLQTLYQACWLDACHQQDFDFTQYARQRFYQIPEKAQGLELPPRIEV